MWRVTSVKKGNSCHNHIFNYLVSSNLFIVIDKDSFWNFNIFQKIIVLLSPVQRAERQWRKAFQLRCTNTYLTRIVSGLSVIWGIDFLREHFCMKLKLNWNQRGLWMCVTTCRAKSFPKRNLVEQSECLISVNWSWASHGLTDWVVWTAFLKFWYFRQI